MQYELPWNGEPFRAEFLAYDTETAVHGPDGKEYDLSRAIPPLVLATVSDGTRTAVLFPGQLPEFTYLHRDTLFVGHNIQFDYWSTLQELDRTANSAKWDWRDKPARGLMDDTMLLDFLVRLAQTGGMLAPEMRSLGKVARLVGLEADKENPYRLRFGELLGTNYLEADRGFFDYAAGDAHVTWYVYKHLLQEAGRLAYGAGVPGDVYDRHGPLTSKLQTRASIVLSQIGRDGMHLDTTKRQEVTFRLVQERAGLERELGMFTPPLFDTYKGKTKWGQYKRTKSGTPRLKHDSLRTHLVRTAEEKGINPEFLPRTAKTGVIATTLDSWRSLAGDTPFVSAWGRMMDLAKTLQFLHQLEGRNSVHPSFRALVRTGRTSATRPNIQQMPREPWFRELFIPRAGHSFIIADYSAIELVTLAAVLENRYGKSTLADVLRTGRKPHDYTAALIMGWDYETVVQGVKAEKAAVREAAEKGLPSPPTPFSDARQAAKAINFGVPGGLGATKLTIYAKMNYGVDMAEEDAKRFRSILTTEIYPELARYLDDDPFITMAANLQCEPEALDRLFDVKDFSGRRAMGRMIDNVIARGGNSVHGHSYARSFVSRVWGGLQALNRNPALDEVLKTWESGPRVRLALSGQTVTTLTGRVRGGADYGEARNTPFQGLAADGAKVALWELFQQGHKIVNFVHDEIVIESPGDRAEDDRKHVERIMKESMTSVLLTDIPVEVEGVVAEAWLK